MNFRNRRFFNVESDSVRIYIISASGCLDYRISKLRVHCVKMLMIILRVIYHMCSTGKGAGCIYKGFDEDLTE